MVDVYQQEECHKMIILDELTNKNLANVTILLTKGEGRDQSLLHHMF